MKNKKKSAFTLIELLLVVLLAAVALPQYQKVVEKSRIVRLLPQLRSLKDQLEVYYMANGSYPADMEIERIGISISGCSHISGGMFNCGDYGFDYNGYPPHADPSVIACTGAAACQPLSEKGETRTKLIWYLDNASVQNKKECTSKIRGLCNSLAGIWN